MSWYSYEDAREQKQEVQREIARRRARGESLQVLAAPAGNSKLVRTFWGQAWCRHLEKYSDYATRLPRGRSYLRQGSVYDLQITPGHIHAAVAGSSLYGVEIDIRPLAAPAWQKIKTRCAGQVASLLDLLSGRLGSGVLATISDPQDGLFPQPSEIRFNCSCPDYVDLCKHSAAVLYGIGVRFESEPELFFVLRSVDPAELIASREQALTTIHPADQALQGEDLSALFGISLAEEVPLFPSSSPPRERVSAKPESQAKMAQERKQVIRRLKASALPAKVNAMAKGNNAHRKEVKKRKKEKPKPLPTQK